MSKKGAEERKDLVEARLQYENVLVISKGEGESLCIILLFTIDT